MYKNKTARELGPPQMVRRQGLKLNTAVFPPTKINTSKILQKAGNVHLYEYKFIFLVIKIKWGFTK
jgi:hypothetical protein